MLQDLRGTLAVEAMIEGAKTPEEVEAFVAREQAALEAWLAESDDD